MITHITWIKITRLYGYKAFTITNINFTTTTGSTKVTELTETTMFAKTTNITKIQTTGNIIIKITKITDVTGSQT